jgi:chromosomal replication initiator protein
MSTNVDILWNRCLEGLKVKLSQQVFQEQFAGLRILDLNDRRALIEVPLGRDIRQFGRLYKGLIEICFQETTGFSPDFEFRHPEQGQQSSRLGPIFRAQGIAINPSFSFESFVVGGKSQFAYSAAFAVAQHPGGGKYNPMLLYGGSGLGKTHLIQAIANYVLEGDSGKRVRYLTADDFSREYVECLKENRINEMSNYYRNEVDVLLIDDIQFLSGKIETQNEFFHIFNSLHQVGRQIVLTSDAPPSEIKDLQERLISRFSWGLCVDIQPPDVETREAILRKKSEASHIEMGEDVIRYLAQGIEGNVRLLESAVRKLLLLTNVRNCDIDISLAKEVVSEMAPTIKKRVNLEAVVHAVALHFSVDENKILEKGRGTKEVAQARQVAMFLMKQLTHLSLKSVGIRFGNRDHSTVVHAIKTVEKGMSADPSFKRAVENLLSNTHD